MFVDPLAFGVLPADLGIAIGELLGACRLAGCSHRFVVRRVRLRINVAQTLGITFVMLHDVIGHLDHDWSQFQRQRLSRAGGVELASR